MEQDKDELLRSDLILQRVAVSQKHHKVIQRDAGFIRVEVLVDKQIVLDD